MPDTWKWLLSATCLLSGFAGAGTMWFSQRPGQLHHFLVDGDTVQAVDRRGAYAWSFRTPGLDHQPIPDELPTLLQIDLNGDGEDELLVPRISKDGNHALTCLGSRGGILWSRELGRAIATDSRNFAPPFQITGLKELTGFPDSLPRVLVVSHHHTFHPCQLLVLNARGEVESEFWHSGHLHSFAQADIDGDGSLELLAGGISNAYGRATVLILKPSVKLGTPLENNPQYQIAGLPQGVELGRAVFERTELGRALSPMSALYRITPSRAGFQFDVRDAAGAGDYHSVIYFQTDRQLRLLEVNFSDLYRFQQERLLREGILRRPMAVEEFKSSTPMQWIKQPSWLPDHRK